ncbi:hypothetical protein ACLOJK_005790 [Asimina triloba]
MAQKGNEASLAALVALQVLLLLCFGGGRAHAQSSNSNCTSELVGLSPCLSYISGSSQTPDSSCCTQLASVVQSAPQCLCLVLNGGATSLGITINQTKALELPAACNVQTTAVSDCSRVAGGPGVSPVETPTAGGGSKAVPGTSHASSTTPLSLSFLFSLVAIASYAAASFASVF